jgi:hypothetical protein
MVAIRGAAKPPAYSTHESLFLHQADDALPANMDVLLLQGLVHTWAAVILPPQEVRLVNQHLQPLVLDVVWARWPASPRIEAGARDTQRPA